MHTRKVICSVMGLYPEELPMRSASMYGKFSQLLSIHMGMLWGHNSIYVNYKGEPRSKITYRIRTRKSARNQDCICSSCSRNVVLLHFSMAPPPWNATSHTIWQPLLTTQFIYLFIVFLTTQFNLPLLSSIIFYHTSVFNTWSNHFCLFNC